MSLIFNSVNDVFGQELGYIISVISALVLGLIIALAYSVKIVHTKGFVLTLALLPLMVQTVIMLVNGNIGAGVAVAGAFSLVRFRSAPGSAREIASVFLAMTVGLACGMGYVGVALIVSAIISLIYLLTSLIGEKCDLNRILKITIPENLDYTQVFDSVFIKFTDKYSLVKVKTTNMGSLYKLTYNIKLKKADTEKDFIDELRIRNGNLEIVCSHSQSEGDGLL